ncbi:translation initiation factor IF-2 [Lacrimispora saccharolytica]|uniref:Translation initiation factor IF-2 n=1 Tax=Lacrimispora saccharolytica (strain ATCC 35040 / DSM 2544 / NRCC 2533 / WM1) TaxID=610130 RepID=D9R784_LACSW|nr:translation initiation factor IF-2 [Lacrimispora saccharolytica]ADL05516.1 translation initiation factor IF-2 [[Clostridium] saccharolyticum WM1]QRV20322.1 translation initiation factor IF-2 [Lacrimispora saccharolytica]
MRVYDLAKELGKDSSKEILDILEKHNINLKSSSNISDEQAAIVKKEVGGHSRGTSPVHSDAPDGDESEAPKKKIAAVFRPQNAQMKPQGQHSQQQKGRDGRPPQASGPNGGSRDQMTRNRQVTEQSLSGNAEMTREMNTNSGEGGRPQGGYQGNRDNRGNRPQGGYQGNRDNRDGRPQGQGGYQGNRDGRPQGQGGYQGNRDGRPQGQGGYQGNRDGRPQGQGGYQGNRDGRPQGQGGYQGNRDGRPQGQGGYQGNRDGRPQGQGGYQGNRDGRPQGQGGYQGNRDGRPQGQGGYQGNRDGRPQGQGGYQGNRDGRPQGQGGYQGNRDGRPQGQGGYQGNRDGRPQGQGGYQGNRDGRPQGGYQGNRDGRDGDSRGARPQGPRTGRDSGQKTGSFDTPIQAKPTSNRATKNAYKNDRFDKRDKDDEAKKRAQVKGGKPLKVPVQPPVHTEPKVEEIKTITLPDILTIKELAEKMKLQPSAIVKKLFLQGKIVTLNTEIDFDQAEEIAMGYDVLCEKEIKVDVIEELLKEAEENVEDMVSRPPVVCVMGHVDHGKTSLLDAIRQTNVTSREAGGITQHIGAYTVEVNGEKITFLDTPGHEAFTAMRMRGAQSTDIAILVVAADDGVMPQTVEAINHAKAAEVEIIVAINKIDKPSANIDRVKQELSEYELIPEDWGGSTVFVPVSAHTKEGIKELLEMILLTAEVKELKANPDRRARGLIIEAELDKGKGPVATVLVQKGTLHVGDTVAAGSCYGKVRAMMDDKGRRVKEAGPSTPVEILGLNDVPNAGEVLVGTEHEKEARSFAETFISEGKNKLLEDTKAKLSLDDLFSQIKAGNIKELPIIVKADVQGSVEAVKQSLVKLSNEEVMVKVIHGGVGAINESDVSLASASNAIIIGFNVRPDVTAKSIADREKVDMRLYKVIYQAIEDVEAAMKGMLDPVFEEKIIGHAIVRQTFKASGVGTIAGSYVMDGKFQRGCSVRITRAGEKIYEGPLASLKRFKDDVKEVATGYECGLVFEKFNDIQEDDMIEAYAMVEVPR